MKQLWFISIFLLCAVVSITAQELQISKSQATNIVLTEILKDKIGKVDIHISKSPIASKDGFNLHNKKISCPYSSNWVVFVDDYVFANWEHPCRYIFINSAKKEYTIVNDVIFPENMDEFEKLSGVQLPAPKLQKINKVNKEAAITTVTPNPHYYAVIINGGVNDYNNHIRYWNDISSIYCTLTQVYGYMPENIYVHSTDGTAAHNHGLLDLDNDGTADIDLPASESSIGTTFQTLAGTIGPDDQLFVYVTDHGGRDANGSYIYLWGSETLTTSELQQMMSPVNTSEIINVMEQCYSGGFVTDANNITGSHRVVQSACSATEYSWSEVWITDGNYDEFVFYWTAAARGYYPGANAWELGDAIGSFPFDNFFTSHPTDYNPDTNGDGVVQMQEAFNYANNFDTWSTSGYYNPYYTGYSEAPTPYHNIGFQENLLSLTGLKGNITNTQTVSGNFLVSGNLNIQSGYTVTVNSSSNFSFLNNTSMIVNGTLSANGTSANHITFDRSGTSGSWGGIVFNSGSSGSVEYCDISHAATGITCSSTLPMIRHNTISNNTTGISVSNVGTVSNEISYNTIQSNTYQGISLYTASPKIYSNTISGNAYYGISCNYYSSPYLYGNTITGHPSSALSCYYYSSARLVPWNAYGYYWGAGHNKIKNNTGDGIIASYWSNLYLGSSPYGGYNSICNNTGYELRAYYGCTITAEINWWGADPPNVNEFYPYQSTVDYLPALPSDPNPDPEQGMDRGPNGIYNSSTINSAKSALDKAYGLQSEGKFDEAIAVYDSYINANSTDSKSALALVRIDECYKLSGKAGAATYLDNTIKTKANKNNEFDAVSLELKNQYLIQDKRFEEAVNNLNKLAAVYKTNKDVEKHSLFNAGYVYLTYLNDYKNATAKFAELAAKYPDDELVSESEYLLGNLDANNQQKSASPNTSQSDLPVPTEYALDQNYPNPFNPATTITYQLPKSGNVTLKIFDILGNEVKTLVNENKEMGRYTVQFDASSLASGMYVYQLRANDYTSTKKMLLLK